MATLGEFIRRVNADAMLSRADREELIRAKREQISSMTREQRVQDVLARRQESQQSLSEQSPLAGGIARNVVSPAISAGASFIDRATFGRGENVLAALAAPVVAFSRGEPLARTYRDLELEIDARLEASKRLDPKASFAGDIAGFFRGPQGVALGAAGQLGARAAGAGARALPFIRTTAAESGGLNFARRAAAQLVESMGASSAAITTMEFANSRVDNASVGKRLEDSWDAISSPTNLILNGAVGIPAALLRSKPDAQFQQILSRLQARMPGLKVSPAELRPGSEVQGTLASIGKLVGGRRTINSFMEDSFYKPLSRSISSLRDSFFRGTREAASRTAAAGIRGLVGTKARPGTLERARIEKQEALFGEFGGQVVPQDQVVNLLRVIGDLNKRAAQAKGTLGARGSRYGEILGDLKKLASRSIRENRRAMRGDPRARPFNVTIQQLDNLRDRMDEIAGFNKIANTNNLALEISGRDMREARVIRHAIRQVYREIAPEFDTGLKAIRGLRVLEQSLSPVVQTVKTGMTDEVITAMANRRDFIPRLKALQKTNPQAYQAFQGTYLGRFIENMTVEANASKDQAAILSKTMNRIFRGNSMFKRDKFDRILGPQVRQWFEDVAEVSDRFGVGIGQALGSPTATRTADAIVLGAGIRGPQMLYDMLTDIHAGHLFVSKSIFAASALTTFHAIRSVVNGRIGRLLNKLASGERVVTPTTGAAALQGAGEQAAQSTSALINQFGAAKDITDVVGRGVGALPFR